MPAHDPTSPDGDPFGPPAIPTLVACLHCGREYDSYRIEWRVEHTPDGPHGFWCCPVPGCGGRGFGFDILPVDPDYRDENGGWFSDDEPDDEESDETDSDPDPPPGADAAGGPDDDGPLPW